MKRFVFLLTFVCAMAQLVCTQNTPARVPAAPYPIEVKQPDGTSLTIFLRGDEWRHYTKTIDGYVVCQNARGYYCYARLNCKGETVPGCRIAKNADERSASDWRYLRRMEQNKKLYKP